MNIAKFKSKMKDNKNRIQYLLLFFALGVLLMLYPTFNASEEASKTKSNEFNSFSVEKEEARLAEILSAIEGVGTCKVLLSVYDTAETIPSEDESNTIILSNNRKQSDVAMQTTQPEFLGAIIVSGGSDNANIRYDILSSVMAYTGLSVDRISICPIQE